jgi:beta-glucosidase
MVRGYQGNDLTKNNTVLACIKHFALYGAAEGGRDYNTTDMSRIRMYQEYFPPYLAAVRAGAGSVMTSFNEVEGIPASANTWLMTDLLRKTWGFNGLIVTDYTAINEMMAHGMGDAKTVGALALNAGVDMDMVGEIFLNEGVELVKSGKVSMARLDEAVRKILEAKYKLGLFEDPYKYVSEERAAAEIMNESKLALAKEAAIKSSVLLKNNNQVLPLDPTKKIAFIGPLIKDQRNLIGNWSGAGDPKKAVSIWSALEKNYPAQQFLYAKGCNLLDDTILLNKLNPHDAQIVADAKSPADLITEAIAAAVNADVLVVALGEAFGMTGEAASRSLIGLPDNQVELLKALKKTGKPIVLILMNGRPLTLTWEDENMDAILETWFPGTQAGAAITDLLFGKANPSGRITMSFPRNVGQVPVYYNAKNTGRPFDPNQKYTSKYLDVANTPLYPFGYGLSYTSFQYGEIKLDRQVVTNATPVKATITVTNSGNFDGEEVVQLYIRDMVGSVTRPVLELKSFQKIALKKGESREVSFVVKQSDLQFFNSNLKLVAEPGDFKLFIGSNSRDLKEADFRY